MNAGLLRGNDLFKRDAAVMRADNYQWAGCNVKSSGPSSHI